MADAMFFPDTFEEFVKWFGFVDSGEHYTNGSELIQVFRVKQWLEHEFNRLEEENANYSRNNRSLTEAVTEMQKALKNQSAEIERLKNECFCIANECDAIKDCIDTAVEEAKAEAIKEFAERLKEKAEYHENGEGWEGDIYYADDVDNLVKEMVGDAE